MELEVKSWSLGLLWHNYKVFESGKGTAGTDDVRKTMYQVILSQQMAFYGKSG